MPWSVTLPLAPLPNTRPTHLAEHSARAAHIARVAVLLIAARLHRAQILCGPVRACATRVRVGGEVMRQMWKKKRSERLLIYGATTVQLPS